MTKNLPRMLTVLCGTLLLCPVAASAAETPAAPTTSPANQVRLGERLQALVDHGVPGALVFARDGDHQAGIARGLADLESGRPLRPDDRFRNGSVTKPYVATVVLQLVHEGRLRLDDTVERWLPGLVANGDAIRIRDLLGLRSGIADFEPLAMDDILADPTRFRTPMEMIAIGLREGPLFAPGTRFNYSSTDYLILGRIIERATGRTVEANLRERLFKPLRLKDTTFDLQRQIAGPHAHGYVDLDGRQVDTSRWSPSWGEAAGAITTTGSDIARFQRHLMAGDLLPPALLAEMTDVKPAFFGDEAYGLGIIRSSTFMLDEHYRTSCGPAWGHTGGIPGYRTWAYSTRDGKRQFVVFINTYRLNDEILTDLTRVIESAYCGR